MTAVFSHGRLRLYLLGLLAEGPKHGYELIRLLENRFLGLYAPSAGTVYPRLARMEVEGLVIHTAAGGRKTYEITDAGRAELDARQGELATLESEIHASVADLTALANDIERHDIERQVSGSVHDVKRQSREAARQARMPSRAPWQSARVPQRVTVDARGDRGSAGGQPALADLERAVAELVAELADEVRRVEQDAGASESDLRAATAVVRSALTELRRRLRR